MYYVYILKSQSQPRLYVGCSANLERRVAEHNRGCVRSTKAWRPYKLVYSEACATKRDAVLRERFLKYTPQGGILKKQLVETKR